MPVAVIQEWSQGGDDTTNYDAIHAKLTAGEDPPEGFLLHTAGATGDGRFRIFEVWESRDHFDRFVQERLMPVVKEVGGGGDPPTVTSYPLHAFMLR
jgi:quinol monooxygenase YgiN